MTTVEHPLIADRLTHLRSKDSSSQEFRTILQNIATLMVPDLLRGVEAHEVHAILLSRSREDDG